MSSPANSTSKEAGNTRVRKRPGKVARSTQAPLGGVPFKRFVYILAAVVLAYSVYYAYRFSQIQQAKAGNFQRNLRQAQGKPREPPTDEEAKRDTRALLQQRIEDLASMVGIEPISLASAIAGIVASEIPAESSSSIMSEAKETKAKGNNPVLSAFTEGLTAPITPTPAVTAEATTTAAAGGFAATIASVVQAVGFDDMGMDAD